jgi:hypothetical protein
MRSQSGVSALVLAAATLCPVLGGCGDEAIDLNPPVMMQQQGLCGGMPAQILTGNIDKDLQLTADKRWLLVGQVKVIANTTLRIEPGTVVCGDASDPTKVSFLNVEQDAKLIADGTAARPIVFTSSKVVGERKTSDWGGVVLRGRAQINLPPGDKTACGSLEGNAGSYGPCGTLRNDDNSGTLRYVRIEFAGREVAPNNELNGLTLGAVGSGTVIDYVQVHRGSDDGFEMFGGTVNLSHLVATAGLDDAFDWDQGWQGKGQFWVSQQILQDGNNGIEADNSRDNNALLPRSSPTIFNVTLVGTGRSSQTKGEKRFAMTLRQGTDGMLRNVVALGFKDLGVVLSQESTCAELLADRLSIGSSLFWDNGADATSNVSNITTVGTVACDVKAWLVGKGNQEKDPQLRTPYDLTQPDFRPTAASPALAGAATPPAGDAFFAPASYLGAFGPDDATNWIAGWTAFPQN